MMTLREAIQRLNTASMKIIRQSNNLMVVFQEDRKYTDHNTYITDDLEDAVIQGMRMRKKRLQSI